MGAVVALNEKNGKLHAMPCHPKLEDNQDAYMACAAIARALFRCAI